MKEQKTYKYLTTLDKRENEERILLPLVNEDTLLEIEEKGNKIVLANDWFSQGAYEFGAFTIKGDKYMDLQDREDTRIANPGGNFIFENGTLDHKGLIAIEIPEGTEFFVMLRGGYDIYETRFFFEPGTDESYVEKVVSMMTLGSEKVSVTTDQKLSVTPKEYRELAEEESAVLF